MTPDQLIVFGVLFLTIVALATDLWSPDAVLLTAVAIVTASGVITLEQAAIGFGNTTLLALGSLYVLAAALRESGHWIGQVDSFLVRGQKK